MVRTASAVKQAHILVAYRAAAGSRPHGGVRLAETTQQSGKRLSKAHFISRLVPRAGAEEARPPVTLVPPYWSCGTYRGIGARPSPPPPLLVPESLSVVLSLVATYWGWQGVMFLPPRAQERAAGGV